MTWEFFESEMKRMSENFGKAGYSNERVKLIWREVKDLDDNWFSRLVDSFIGDCRQAPLVPEFRNAASEERERAWKREKEKSEKEAQEFMQSSFADDDVRGVIQQIVGRVKRTTTDEAFDGLQRMLSDFAGFLSTAECKKCDDSGVLFFTDDRGYQFVKKCDCPKAKSDRRKFTK